MSRDRLRTKRVRLGEKRGRARPCRNGRLVRQAFQRCWATKSRGESRYQVEVWGNPANFRPKRIRPINLAGFADESAWELSFLREMGIEAFV